MRKELISNLIAHRGVCCKTVVENTLPAFLRCMRYQYIIELDVRLLKDNTIAVFHDSNLHRLTEISKNVENCTYDELKKIKVKGKYIVPTLEYVLKLVNGKVPILIDIKGKVNNYNLEEELLKQLEKYRGEIYIQSFQVRSLNYMWKKQRKYSYGLIILNSLHLKLFTKLWVKFRYDFIACEISAVKSKQLQKLRKNKLLIGWTVTDKKYIQKYSSYCDNFICENIE